MFLASLNCSLITDKVRDDGWHRRVETRHTKHPAVVRVGEGKTVGGHAHNDCLRVSDGLARGRTLVAQELRNPPDRVYLAQATDQMENPGFRIILTVLCALGIFANRGFAIADAGGPKIGEAPPPLVLSKTLQGQPASEINWSKLKGKVVVLEFWATWCGPCVKAIPHLNGLADEFKSRPVVFVSVTSENEDVVQMFLKKHPMKPQIGLDDYELLSKAFHVQGIPHAVIVDAGGRIAAIARPDEIDATNLDEVLAGKKCSLPQPAIYTIDRSSNEVASNQAPALFEISIREHKMPQQFEGPACMWSSIPNDCGFEGKISTVQSALDFLFHKTSARTLAKCKLPDGFYDFELQCPSGHATELKEQFVTAMHTTFGLEIKQTTKVMDVYLMTQISTNAPGVRKADKPGGGGQMRGGFRSSGSDMKGVAASFEDALGRPVFDETTLKGFFAVNMKWKLSKAEKRGEFTPDPEAVAAAARERLGLQLTLVQRPLEVLEVSEARQ